MVSMWAWMQCKISRVSASSWLALKEETSRYGSDELTVVASVNPLLQLPLGALSGCVQSDGLKVLALARSALFPASAMKLGQSDGRGTDELFSILRRTGLWRCLRLVLVSALID